MTSISFHGKDSLKICYFLQTETKEIVQLDQCCCFYFLSYKFCPPGCISWAVAGTGAQAIPEARKAGSLLRGCSAISVQLLRDAGARCRLCLLFQMSTLAWSQLHPHSSQPKVYEVTFTVDSESRKELHNCPIWKSVNHFFFTGGTQVLSAFNSLTIHFLQ